MFGDDFWDNYYSLTSWAYHEVYSGDKDKAERIFKVVDNMMKKRLRRLENANKTINP